LRPIITKRKINGADEACSSDGQHPHHGKARPEYTLRDSGDEFAAGQIGNRKLSQYICLKPIKNIPIEDMGDSGEGGRLEQAVPESTTLLDLAFA
jgi:hypothetical protein